jgi:hypothetical protein
MKMEVRKYFAYSQLAECLVGENLDYPSIGVSIKPVEMTRREMIAPSRLGPMKRVVKETYRSGNYMVTKGDAPSILRCIEQQYRAFGGQDVERQSVVNQDVQSSPDNAIRMDLVARKESSSQYQFGISFLGSDVLSGFLFIHNIAISPEGHDVTS